jgi:hypothetical protein
MGEFSHLPDPKETLLDAGPYFNMGFLRAEDPETGECDVTIHQLCVQGPKLLSAYFVPGRRIFTSGIASAGLNSSMSSCRDICRTASRPQGVTIKEMAR